ncbi:MAG: MFS transporter [Eubacteriales bacterium]
MIRKIKAFISDDTQHGRGMKNSVVLLIRNAFFGSSLVFGSNALLQTFLSQRGVDDMHIGMLGSAASITHVVITFLLMGFCDRFVRPMRLVRYGVIFQAVLPATVVILIFSQFSNTDFLFYIVLFASIAQAIFGGARNLVETKVFAHMVPASWLGHLLGADGMATGFFAVIASLITVALTHSIPPPFNIAVLFMISLVFMLTSGGLTGGIRLIDYHPASGNSASPLRAIGKLIKMAEFNRLIIPNILRGITIGVALMIMPIGIFRLGMTLKDAAYVVTAGTVANIAGSAAFTLLIKKLKSQYIALLGNTLGIAGLAVMTFSGTIPLFVFGAFLLLFGKEWVDRVVPLGVYEIVPSEVMGAYSAGRMILMFASMALSQFAIGFLIGRVEIFLILGGIAAAQLTSGVLFMIYFKKFKAARAT